MNRLRALLALGVSVFFLQSALAVDAVFDPTVKQKANIDDWTDLEWTNTVFWTDTDGQPLAVCPQTAADNVSFTNYYNYGNAQVYLGQMKETATPALADWAIGTMVGPVGYALLFPYSHNYWLNASKQRRLTVGNPDGFKGLWGARSGRQELVVQPTETYVPALSHVEINARMIVNVPSHAATVESLDRFGALEKSGSGDLGVVRTDGANTKIYVTEGSVTLAGTVADAPVAGAALHLDASLPDVFEKEKGEDGQTHVTLWKSALGPEGVSAGISSGYSIRGVNNHLYKEDVTTPVLSGQKSSTDLTLLDFSANTCAMTLSQPITGIRQVFYVASRSNMNAAILGSSEAGEYPFMGNGGGTSLFSRDYAAARFGYIEANGTPVSNHVYPRDSYSPSSDNLILVSVEMPTGVTVRDIATERYYTYSTGCAKIGEILIYTRTLTATERKQVTDYLMRKWFAAYSANKAVDAENAVLVGEDASIGVAAGATAKVNGLGTHGSKVTKTGDGDLVVRSVGPAAAALDIRGGTVKFAGPPEGASDAAPADDPYCWLTADAGYDETSYTDDAGRLCVTTWADCRGANGRGVYATLPTSGDGTGGTTKYFSGKPPYVRQAADNPVDSNGHAVMRFTYEDASTAMENLTWMWLMPHGTAYAADPQAYDGFIVYRQTTDDSNLGPFGSCDQDLMRYNKSYLFLSPSFGAPASYIAYSARWTLDGVPVDPCGPFVAARHGAASGYHVAAVSSDTKLPLDYLAKDRIGSGSQGKMEIGEFIIYDRKLTALERRNTEAYLLKKWLRREHPDKSPTLAKTIYGADAPAVVDTDAPAANLGTIEGGNGTLVKRGTGPVALRTQDMSASGLETLKVEAGTLTLQPQFDRDAAFHVDASNRGNFGFDAEGKVQYWYDENGNCTATATINDTSTRVRPSLKTVTINGVEKTVVDFGDFTRYKTTDTSGMRETSAGMKFDRSWKDVITEAHIVARTVGLGALSENASFFTYTGNEVTTFLRGAGQNNDNYKIFHSTWALAYHGQVMLDGAVSSGDARVGTSSFVTLTSVPAPDKPCSINSICMDRSLGGGGLEIAEIIAFTNSSTAVRANYVHNYLRKKWFGADVDLVMTNHYASIEVATGATLNASGIVLDVQSVGGAGTVNAEAVIGVSALSLAFDASGTASAATTLTCPVAFDGPVTVNVSAAAVKAVQAGVYPVITAPTIGETDVSAWTIEADETLTAHRVLSLVKSGNTLSLKVDRKGMAIIVR